MQEYSMLFLDIDGTVLDTQNRISPNLKQLFKKLNQEEISIVLNSSRSPSGSMETRRETGLRNPCICYGGGLVVGDKEQIIAECGIPALVAMILWFFSYFVRCVVLTRRLSGTFYAAIPAGLAGGLVACYLQSCLEWVLRQQMNLIILMVFFALLDHLAANAASLKSESAGKGVASA